MPARCAPRSPPRPTSSAGCGRRRWSIDGVVTSARQLRGADRRHARRRPGRPGAGAEQSGTARSRAEAATSLVLVNATDVLPAVSFLRDTVRTGGDHDRSPISWPPGSDLHRGGDAADQGVPAASADVAPRNALVSSAASVATVVPLITTLPGRRGDLVGEHRHGDPAHGRPDRCGRQSAHHRHALETAADIAAGLASRISSGAPGRVRPSPLLVAALETTRLRRRPSVISASDYSPVAERCTGGSRGDPGRHQRITRRRT